MNAFRQNKEFRALERKVNMGIAYGTHSESEIDHVLEQMDELWPQLSEEERQMIEDEHAETAKLIRNHRPRCRRHRGYKRRAEVSTETTRRLDPKCKWPLPNTMLDRDQAASIHPGRKPGQEARQASNPGTVAQSIKNDQLQKARQRGM